HTRFSRDWSSDVCSSDLIFFPLAGDAYIAAKTVTVGLFCAVLAGLLAKRRIDLLNLCAGITVAFVCLWLDKGAMTRMNIAMVFAVASLASLSSKLFAYFSIALAAVSAAGYALGLGLLRVHPDSVDALLALMFVLAYLAALLAYANVERTPGSCSNEPNR